MAIASSLLETDLVLEWEFPFSFSEGGDGAVAAEQIRAIEAA